MREQLRIFDFPECIPGEMEREMVEESTKLQMLQELKRFHCRKERIAFVRKKKGKKFVEEVFPEMTDREVKAYFEEIYFEIKEMPDFLG